MIATVFLLAGQVQAEVEFIELVKGATFQEAQEAIEAGANVNARNEAGVTPLIAAARHNHNPQIIFLLIENGATIRSQG